LAFVLKILEQISVGQIRLVIQVDIRKYSPIKQSSKIVSGLFFIFFFLKFRNVRNQKIYTQFSSTSRRIRKAVLYSENFTQVFDRIVALFELKKNLYSGSLFYYQALRIFEHAVLPTAVV
jgi:hypothetical protein